VKADIDRLIASFFAVFDNRAGKRADVAGIRDLFVADGLIAKCVAPAPEIMALDDFIEPREELLSNGTLIDFFEVETSETTQIFGHIAQRLSNYEKSGILNGTPFVTRGVKTFQLLQTPAGWRILSMMWDDED